MDSSPYFVFGPFRLDPINKYLWCGEEQLTLRPMAGAVLLMLAERVGEVVTKEEIFKRVWAGTRVTDTVLRVCIREIRKALGDSAEAPRYIETIGRQGYRFVGVPRGEHHPVLPQEALATESIVVGRTPETIRRKQWFSRAERGERQIVFVTGEPGIGKSTVVDLFLNRLRPTALIRIGQGQCCEHYGKGEAYLPILEALIRLSREPGGAQLITLLSRYAPTWLTQMPALLSDEEFIHLQNKIQGTTPQRMLREMAEALEVLTRERPLVLVLEDLHWSDHSTVELLNYLAQRREFARLMIIGTYRPSDIVPQHPLRMLKQELQLRNCWKELPLDLLTEQEVKTYVSRQFPKRSVPEQLATAIYHRTEGNPFFMVNVVKTLAEQAPYNMGEAWKSSVLDCQQLAIPENLQQTIEQRFERLGVEERSILEAASVAGSEFTAATVAAALGKRTVEVEDCCRELARRKQFIHTNGTGDWPDGTVTERYGFIHALYQEVLYNQVSGGKKAFLHKRIGERLEEGYRTRRHEVAAELALHFEKGRDLSRTVQYLGQAAENANQKCAYPEALRHLEQALELLKMLPSTPEQVQQEIMLQIALGMSLMATKGYAAPEVKSAYDRARELCLQVGETPQLVFVLRGLSTFYYVRAELQTAKAIAEQLLDLVQSQQDRTLLLQASYDIGGTLFNLGEVAAAHQHLQRAMLFADSHPPLLSSLVPSQDTGILCLARMSHVLWFLGYPDQARAKSEETLSAARTLIPPHTLTFVLTFAAGLNTFCRAEQKAQQCAEEARRLAAEHGFPIWATMGQILSGSILIRQDMIETGINQIVEGLAAWRSIGAQISVPYFLSMLAEAYGKSGHPEKGLQMLTEALTLTHTTEERWWEAESYRLKGELTLQKFQAANSQCHVTNSQVLSAGSHFQREAEACFLKAIEIAQRQQAKSLELRATISLARLKQRQQNLTEALSLLEEVYHWFTEGFDTADLQEAKQLLIELREQSSAGQLPTLRTSKTRRKTTTLRQPSPEPRVARSIQG